MSDLERRLTATFNHVAQGTRGADRIEEFPATRRRRFSGLAVAAATFVLVGVVVALPVLFRSADSPVGPASAPTTTTLLSQAPSTAPPTTPPRIVVDPSWLTADSSDIEAIIEAAGREGPGGTRPAGWRPPLVTERALCLFSPTGTPGTNGAASDFPLDEPLTEAEMEAWCRSYGSYSEEPVGETFTICRGVYADADIETVDEMHVVEGDNAGPRPGFPVVLAWDEDCESVELTTTPAVDLDADLDLDAVNRARTIEIGVTGAALTNCFSLEEAWALAEAIRAELGEEWLLVEGGPPPLRGDGCHQPHIDLQWGVISLPDE